MTSITKTEMTEQQARDILGLDDNQWTVQFTDEELRMLQDIMRAETRRREDIFGALNEKIDSFGDA